MAPIVGKQKTTDRLTRSVVFVDHALERSNVFSLKAFLAFCDVELDALVFFQRTVSAGLNGAEVCKHVSSSVIGCNEPESLIGVEPFNGSLSHGISLFVLSDRSFEQRNNWSKLPNAETPSRSTLLQPSAQRGFVGRENRYSVNFLETPVL
jgi:hypothetical protein